MEKCDVTVQNLLKFYARVQEIHRPDRQKRQLSRSVEQHTDNVHLATSARSICVFWIGGILQLIVYLPHVDIYILQSRPTSNDRSDKAR